MIIHYATQLPNMHSNYITVKQSIYFFMLSSISLLSICAVKTVSTNQSSYTVTECEDPQLDFSVVIAGQPGQGRSCVVTISIVPDTAVGK